MAHLQRNRADTIRPILAREYLFLNNTACNLASLNLMKFKREDGSFDVERFKAAVRIFITAQEILVDNASYPTKEIAENCHIFRTLGLGFANLGALGDELRAGLRFGWSSRLGWIHHLDNDWRSLLPQCQDCAGAAPVSRLLGCSRFQCAKTAVAGQRRVDVRSHSIASSHLRSDPAIPLILIILNWKRHAPGITP